MTNIKTLKTIKILYVEDEIVLRDITYKSLSTIIGQIVVASNGQEGLDKFKNDNFDLIMTDLAMPIMDGIEMIKNIRLINKDIPILVTTAFGSQTKEINDLKKIGMNSYLIKPLDLKKVIETISNLL